MLGVFFNEKNSFQHITNSYNCDGQEIGVTTPPLPSNVPYQEKKNEKVP